MKNALTVMTVIFTCTFLDGFLDLGLSDGFYVLSGFGMIGTLIWMWVIEHKRK